MYYWKMCFTGKHVLWEYIFTVEHDIEDQMSHRKIFLSGGHVLLKDCSH